MAEILREHSDSLGYCSEIRFKAYYYLDYILCRCHNFNYHQPLGPMAQACNASPLLLQNNYDVADDADKAELADYLIVAMNINSIEQQILFEEERLFNHSQSFIKPLCQNDSVYTDSFTGLDKRVSEANEQIFKVSQLKIRLGFEKEKRQIVFVQLAKKMDKQSLKRFIKRVDPRANFEFVSSSTVVYLPVITSANFYQLPSASVVDSGYSSHAHSFGSTPS
ncbi:DUF2179 domain-containing protein [Rickettsiella endosymbiont of Dermanyssus gallinae]|uniref:DUF2179 domain-containing protein n=1 Tax=Rickettsiella endosymbiont of Dermanyssus gallinae TaxID=2856608 RepID=UPI001C52E292|nr:DUF2179 domain-containing protein [Rickettsiella endosymbiont of Dermanyssus gallinae]